MVNLDEQETKFRRSFLRKTSFLLPHFPEPNPDSFSLSTLEDALLPNRVTRDVDMVLGEHSDSIRNYSAFQLSLERGSKEDVACQAAYTLGGICCLMPEVTDDILQGVYHSGARIRIERVSSGSQEISHKKANAFFGYLVIMLYKNVVHESIIPRNCLQILKALFDAAGYDPREGHSDDDDGLLMSKGMDHVIDYLGFARHGRIKEAVLKSVLNHTKDKDSFGDVCSYVAKFLSWKDMTGFYNVYKTLVLTDSIVLSTSSLGPEVKNLHRAVKAVFDTEMPRYFSILKNHNDYNIFASSKFPMLVAVAEKIMMMSTDVNFRLFGSRPSGSGVDYYVALHKQQFSLAIAARIMQCLDEEIQRDEDQV